MLSNLIPQPLRNWFTSRQLGRNAIDTRFALAEACLIGIFSALAALLIKQGIGWLGGWRIRAAQEFGAGIVLPLAGLTLGWLAGWLIERFSPASVGGGIAKVKAALARYPVPLSLRVAVVKLIGTVLVLGAGLPLGRRAPTVHIGAALAAQLSSWIPTSPEHRRQMIAAGAAAGLAAGFTTPIAGVLFVVEELMRDVSGLTLETAIVASFTGAVVSLLLQSADLNFPPSLLNLPDINFSVSEIPFYLILGILAGILGGLFNRGILLGLQFNRRLNLALHWQIGLAGLMSGAIVAILPPFFRDNAGLREFLITGELSWQNIALAFVAHFFLTILAASSGAPGGLFSPALVLGSALGYLVGNVEVFVLGTGAASTYALAGMGAFFTAVVRAPVTAIVIVFELTVDFNIVLPLMITCAISYIVADSVSRGSIYQHLLEARGIQLDEEIDSSDFLNQLTAVEVMQSEVETLSSNLTLEKVVKFMSRSSHRGFPVIEEGKLVGIITQSDLANATQRPPDTSLKEIMTLNPITINSTASLSDVLYLLNRYKLSRLPVTEGSKLIGIVTRTDIIRIEANHLSGVTPEETRSTPSYVVYQTRSPALGKGRILVPFANPETAADLLSIAAAIAQEKNYELECLQVISIPKHSFPAETAVNTQKSRKLMRRAERLSRKVKIPVHTQIRVGHDPSEAILETIRERQIDLLIMGWKGNTSTPGAIFGNVVDTLIHRAPCELVLVKLGHAANAYPHQLEQRAAWLISLGGGPNAERAMELLPGLTALYSRPHSPQLWLCHVDPPNRVENNQDLEETARYLQKNLDLPTIVLPLHSYSVSEAIIDVAERENFAVVILGASRESLLERVLHGNIPEEIAHKLESTVIIFRGAID